LSRHNGFDDDVYARVDSTSMELRDYLATDRTKLANQSTFLAYIRTALTLFVVGLTFVRFFGSTIIETIGWVFVPIGVATFVIGLLRYNRLRLALARIRPPRRDS